MTKQSGLGDNFYCGGYNLSGDVGSLGGISGGPAALEVTGIDKYAPERIGGGRNGTVEWSSWFNDAAGQAHPVLKTLPRTDVHLMYCRGTTLGNAAACMIAKQPNYDGSRGADGSFSFSVQALSNDYGLEWGRLGTAGIRTDTGATNGSSINDSAPSAFGLQAYLQVFTFVGTDATITIQESSDNGGADAWANVTGGSFTAVTAAPTVQRIATSATLAVEQYLRVVTTTAAGFTSMTFAVAICRNLTATVF
jgi:hypothetical protein